VDTKLSRRLFVALGATAAAALAAACNDQSVAVPTKPSAGAPAPTAGSSAPQAAAQGAPAAAAATPTAAAPAGTGTGGAAPAATSAPGGATAAPTAPPALLGQVARNETVIMSVSDTFNQFQDATLANPFLRGQQRTGWHIVYEPLFYYNPYWTSAVKWPKGIPGRETEIPWQAESYEYNKDFTELTIKLRNGVAWSDGQSFTSKDVAFTINMLRDTSPDLVFSFDMKTWVKDVQTPDAQTVKLVLTNPNPQFMGRYFQWFQDLGFPIVPEHVFKGQDYKTFTNLDLAKGLPIGTGPWKLVSSSPDQKVYERRDDWWAAKTGFQRLPKAKRVVILPRFEDAKKIQLHVANEVDATHDMFPANIPALLQRTNKVIFWTDGNKPPYGSVSPSPILFSFNNAREPFNDPEVRWAINYAIDRKQVSDVVYRGTGEVNLLPFNPLPTLAPYFEAAAPLLKKYPLDTSDPAKTAQILEAKGWKKDSEGFWAKNGQRFPMTILLSPGFFQDIGPVFTQQLRKAGFDASFKSPTNFSQLTAQGDVDMFIQFGPAAYRDPWINLDTFHSRYSAPVGKDAAQPYRWTNAQYDKLVDELAQTPTSDPKYMQTYLQAMEIWLKELPVLPTVKWYLRVPFNVTYWKGWANEVNPYVGGGSWHRGAAALLLNAIEPA